jgi:hypothetical protein
MDAAAKWEAITTVTLADGTTLSVDHTFMVAQLRADPPDLAQLDQLLAALLASRDTWPRHVVSSQDMAALDQILARSEFQWPAKEPSQLEKWLQELRDRFWEFIENLLTAGNITIPSIPLLAYCLPGLATLALILILAYALRGLLTSLVHEKKIDTEDELGDKDLTAVTAMKRAQTLSSAGDYRTAVRYLYLSTLLLLEERGLLRYDRSLTNREYLRSIAHRPEMATIFLDVVNVFDRVWYGYQALDEDSYNHYADQVVELQRQQ